MGMRKVYTCDICKDEKPKENMTGLYFRGKAFDFCIARETDGTHICNTCLSTLRGIFLAETKCAVKSPER